MTEYEGKSFKSAVPGLMKAQEQRYQDLLAEYTKIKQQRDIAINHLAGWCLAVYEDASWDSWDDWYKDAMYNPGPLRELVDRAKRDMKS